MVKKSIKRFVHVTENILNYVFLKEYFFKKHFLGVLEKELESCNTILEIGAGKSSYLRLLSIPLQITAIDIHRESLEKGLRNGVFDEIIIGDAEQIEGLVPPYSFDAVVAFDFIEHLEKENGREFLRKSEKIARKAAIIFTPNGFLEQPPTKDNPFQEHRSGWTYEEMEKMGYSIKGINGIKCLSGMYNSSRIKPVSIGNALRNVSAVFLRLVKMEKYSSCILCTKKIVGNIKP